MKRIPALLILALLMAFMPDRAMAFNSAVAAPAPRKIIETSAFFPLSRKVSLKGDDAAMMGELSKRLSAAGMTVDNSFLKRIIGPSVVLVKCENIDQMTARNDAIKIKVTGSKIEIRYTTPMSCYRAMAMLEGLMTTRSGRRVVGGGEYWDWDGVVRSATTRTIDAASRYLSRGEIELSIKRMASAGAAKNGYLMLELVNTDYWRFGVSTFELANPNQTIYPDATKIYTPEQINTLIYNAKKERITLVPVIDLFSENRPFESVTGHRPESVEGMRFVRNVIEQYAKNVKSRKLCLGSMGSEIDKRYLEFVEQIVRDNNLELVSL